MLSEIMQGPMTWMFRMNPQNCPEWIVSRIGIATVNSRRAFYTLDRIIRSMPKIEGSIAECGVYRGSSLLGMTRLLRQKNCKARVFGLDSFEGFPEPSKEDHQSDGSAHPDVEKGHFNDTSYEALSNKAKAVGFDDQITLFKGYFENTLHNLKNEKFSLVHIDCDLYQPYKQCLEFFYDKVLPGGYIVFDEYSFSKDVYPGAQKAIDEFLADKPEKIQSFPEYPDTRYFIVKQ
jgi:O-methyltransferase